ncbi:MAG: MBL fold metallo-hydrolase [Ferruginibacter sp.]|nr:MBL fold metallo-hydrolase [Ferruginibacter sp.]
MIFLLILLLLITAIYVFVRRAPFGQLPSGERLGRIQQSPNYRDGKFQNLSPTPDLAEGVSYYAVMKEFLFNKNKRNVPAHLIPSIKTDLFSLDPAINQVVWFGHSSYLLQIDGKKILVDPVLSGNASPLSFTTKSFKGADIYSADEIPNIDYLFISHDHWDHLDYRTIMKLKPRIGKVICGLGVGQHFERWGFAAQDVIEKDWNEHAVLDAGFEVTVLPARHFSGRGFKRNSSIWSSFALTTPGMKLYLGGDSGYDTHFKQIGEEHGPFDIAILECGQYDKCWKYIHMMPEEVVEAALDLRATTLMPVHWAKFSLGNHAWDDPITRVTKAAINENLPLLTPQIGEAVSLSDSREFASWWEDFER